MPCSLVSYSCPLFHKKKSTINNFCYNNYHIKPNKYATFIINPLSKTLHLPHFSSQFSNKSPLNLTIINFSTTLRPQSSYFTNKVKEQPQESNNKAKIMQLADKIKENPPGKRSKFIDSLINEMGYCQNVDNFNELIMGLFMANEIDIALKLFDEMSLYNLSPDCWTYSVVIRCYCKKNMPDEGKLILDCMIENGFRPNVVTLTILVNSLCSRGKIQRALEVVEMMNEIGCTPNVNTYNCVLKGLCFVGRVEEAYAMLMGMKQRDGSGASKGGTDADIYSYTAVMDGLCKVGRSDEAMELLEEAIGMELKPNVVTYNALFNGYCIEGKPRKGIGLLRQMKKRGCEPDYVTYSTLLHGLLKWSKFMAAFWVYQEMVEAGFKVDERMMNNLLLGLCRKSWEDEKLLCNVQDVFEKMKSWNYFIFPSAYYLVIQSFCIGKEVDMALKTLYEMVEAGYFPRMVTTNRLIAGLCKEGKVVEALSVLVLVCETGKFPSKISFNILIDELNSRANVLGACNVYGAALKLGVIPHRVPLGAKQIRSH